MERSPPKVARANQQALYGRSAVVPESMLCLVDEIHKVGMVGARDERRLGDRAQAAERLKDVQALLRARLEREPTNEEWAAAAGKINLTLLSETLDDGLAAKNALVTANLRLVQRVVNVYIRNGLASQYNAGDLMQEGTMALVRAAEKFQPVRRGRRARESERKERRKRSGREEEQEEEREEEQEAEQEEERGEEREEAPRADTI
jgi:hypothetical protein